MYFILNVTRLERKLKDEKETRNTLEQYTRKDNIKIFNLQVQGDKEGEKAEETEVLVLELIHRDLGLTSIGLEHISIAHRRGPFRRQNRPVVV